MAGLDQYFMQLSHGSVPQREAMKYEALRLSTFTKIPRSVTQSAVVFANAGFFYGGVADEVECYCCGLRFKDWRPDDNPMEIHKKYGPNCSFITNNSDNQPLASKGIFQVERIAAKHDPINMASQALGQLALTPEARITSSALAPQSDAVIEEAPVTLQSTTTNIEENRHFNRPSTPPNPAIPAYMNGSFPLVRPTGGSTSPVISPVVNGNIPSARPIGGNALFSQTDYSTYDTEDPHSYDYRYERSRLSSFRNWPSNAAVKPEDVAKSGFYYTGMDDRVQCAFCRGILRNWEQNDIPDSEHRRHFGQCPFLSNPNDVGNVSLSDELRMTDSSNLSTQIMSTEPMHKKYANPDLRLETFQGFPSNLAHSLELFVDAGLFYEGIDDVVDCFYCGVRIDHWEPNDDPWTEHARGSPDCEYLRFHKGEEFIKEVLSKYPAAPAQSDTLADLDVRKPSRRRPANLRRHLVDDRKVTKYMRSHIVQAVLALNMERDKVRQAIVRRKSGVWRI